MPSPELEPGSRGFIIPIGGAEDKLKDKAILSRFLDLSGGEDCNILIIPTASMLDDTGTRYKDIFEKMGGRHLSCLLKHVGMLKSWIVQFSKTVLGSS